MSVDADPNHLAEVLFVKLHLLPPFHTVLFGRKSLLHGPFGSCEFGFILTSFVIEYRSHVSVSLHIY